LEGILTIDVGTSSLRIIIYDLQGEIKFKAQEEYSMEFYDSRVEQDPNTWKEALLKCFKKTKDFLKDNNLEIFSVSVTSQRASVIPVDERCEPLYKAIMWQDKRSVKQCEKIEKAIGKEVIYKKTGLRIDPYFSLPKMLWLKENVPEVFEKAYKLIGVQDYIVYQLTKKFVTDWTQASRLMIMNIKEFKWDEEILQETGISKSLLCELIPPGTVAGALSQDIAEISNLKTGTPVIIAGGDQQCAALALNVLEPGHAEVNTGTGSFIIAYSDNPVFDKEIRTLCSASAVAGKWICEAGMFTTGSIYRWFKEQFYSWAGEKAFEVMDKEIENVPVGANGVLILPHFEGSAAPYWNPFAKGVIFNLTLGTKRSEIARAILEGICLELMDNMKIIEENIGSIQNISVAGGMTTFDLFNQMQADAFNKRIVKYQNVEATSLGAAMSAAVCMGYYKTHREAFEHMAGKVEKIFEPNKENVYLYEKLLRRKNLLYHALNSYQVYSTFAESLKG